MKLIIIDYGSGNLRSVENAFLNSIADNNLNCTIEVTNNLHKITNADYLVLPGVGSYPDCKKGLQNTEGLIDALSEQVIHKKKKFLGICVGMQLMFDYSLEKIRTSGFGWLTGNFDKIKAVGKDYLGKNYKVPHMGWNSLNLKYISHPIVENISEKDQYYFVHSYYLKTSETSQLIASTNYCHQIPAIVGKENYLGVQFHPEKSSFSGQKLISNWLKWKL
tara:strand:- start:5955 stop:6614 length:660 start_codon:yes stop_codon:yes gene_type:complete